MLSSNSSTLKYAQSLSQPSFSDSTVATGNISSAARVWWRVGCTEKDALTINGSELHTD